MSKDEAPDFYSMIVRKRLGLPEAWRWYKLEAKDGIGERMTMIRGAVPGPPFKTGPRAGEDNWRRRDKATEREVFVSESDIREFKVAWEKETGSCSNCGGSRRVLARWSATEGASYAECPRCSARERKDGP